MIFIYIGMILLAIGAGSIIGWRLYREYLLRKVEKQLSSDALAKRKLRLFKHNLRSGHLLIVLGCSSAIIVSVLLLTVFQLTGGIHLQKLQEETSQLKEEVFALRTEQTEWMRMPIFAYPENGFSFEAIDWEHLLVSNDREAQFAAEYELAYQLSPYLGRTVAMIFVDQPLQEISIVLSSKLPSIDDLNGWEENFSRLLHDMQNVPMITQGTFSVQFSKDSDQSFEQTIIRDENGVWTLLERRFPNTDAQEVANNERSESISSTPQTDQSETINTNEQKGSVKN